MGPAIWCIFNNAVINFSDCRILGHHQSFPFSDFCSKLVNGATELMWIHLYRGHCALVVAHFLCPGSNSSVSDSVLIHWHSSSTSWVNCCCCSFRKAAHSADKIDHKVHLTDSTYSLLLVFAQQRRFSWASQSNRRWSHPS